MTQGQAAGAMGGPERATTSTPMAISATLTTSITPILEVADLDDGVPGGVEEGGRSTAGAARGS